MACDAEHFGGFEHTLFLGCSVVSFSADMGWNEQVAEVTVELVEDDCTAPAASPKNYWDINLAKQTTTLVDPGFAGKIFNIFGLPAYFRVKDFEFTGLIQSWEEVENSSGKRYIVKLITPISILENTKLIIGSYAGGIIPIAGTPYAGLTPQNLINVFGYAEAQGLECPQWYQSDPGTYNLGDAGIDGAVFGTPAGGFGGSLINHNGMPWYMIRNLINVLVNAFPVIGAAANFSSGRLTGRGHNVSAEALWPNDGTTGYGLFDFDSTINYAETVSDYFVDISELPIVPSYFRFNQTEISLLDAISSVCQEAGYDFYIETLPVAFGGSIHKMIKIRTVNRRIPPAFNQVYTYIAAAKANGILRGSSAGVEYRNEVNSRFIIGGNKETLYQAPQDLDPFGDGDNTYNGVSNIYVDDVILPFFGFRDDETMIVPYLDADGRQAIEVDTFKLENSLNYITFSGLPISISMIEILSTASVEQWTSWRRLIDTDTNVFIQNVPNFLADLSLSLDVDIEQIEDNRAWAENQMLGFINNPDLEDYIALARDVEGMARGYSRLRSTIINGVLEDITTIYEWVSSFYTDYYGKHFAVRVPQSCVYTDPENNQLTFSEQPSQGGGWTEVTGIFGLSTTGEATLFQTDDNKISTIVSWEGQHPAHFFDFDPSTYLLRGNKIYLKGQVDSEYVFHDLDGTQIPRAVVSIQAPLPSGDPDKLDTLQGLIKMLRSLPEDLGFGTTNISGHFNDINELTAGKVAADEWHPIARIPDFIAFGMKSNIDTYGPWVSIGNVGGIEIDQDQGLVPWEYNGYTNLNAVGDALAEAGLTNMQASEVGNVSIVGTPTIPLGAELNSLSLLSTNHLFENRNPTSGSYTGTYASGAIDFDHNYAYFDFGFVPSGQQGPSVTNISVSVGTEVTTQYQFRTYTPKYGRFTKLNADRLKEINQNRMKNVRDFRAALRNDELGGVGGAAQSFNKKSALYNNMKRTRDKVRKVAKMDVLGTPHELFVGQITNWGDDRRPIICTSSIHDVKHEFASGINGYDHKSMASLDSLIRPISMQGAGGLPKLISPLGSETGIIVTGVSGTIVSTPTNFSQIDLVPYINPLDPGLVGSGSEHILLRRYDTGLYGANLGHDIDMVSRTNLDSSGNVTTLGVPIGGLTMNNMNSGALGSSSGFDYQDDYRTFALRGPLLLQSWGYDTDDFPIPNQVDTPSGIANVGHESTGLTGLFMSGWLRRSDTWPVAPVDLRLNRQRGLWEAGGLATIVKCLSTTSSSSPAENFAADNVEFFQGSDSSVTGDESVITIENYFGWEVLPLVKIMAIRSAGASNYTALQVQC